MSYKLNPNQFAQTPVKGAVDLNLMKSGILSGIVSANQSGTLYAGQRVKLDTSAQAGVPSFVSAAYNEYAVGIVIATPKANSFTAYDKCQVAMNYVGPIVWMEASAAITAGTVVESVQADLTLVAPLGTTNKKVGLALDGASTSGQLIRVIIAPLATQA
jgi:hypothetical protein